METNLIPMSSAPGLESLIRCSEGTIEAWPKSIEVGLGTLVPMLEAS